MSRCFPFPPPGYEKKAGIDVPDLLAKEKHKEKKHKKEDKEKREGKEKKDKDGHKDKHREKKDRKEKHKERERERDKEKKRSSDAKGIELQIGFCNGEKLGPNNVHRNQTSKHVQELAKRIGDQDGALGSQMAPNVAGTDDRRAKVPVVASESEVVGMVKKINIADKKEDLSKENGQRNHVVVGGVEKPSVQISSCMEQEQGESITKPSGKEEANKQMERKEKKRHKKKEGKGDREKHKDRDQRKGKDSKDKDCDKDKKAEEKVKEVRDSSKEPHKWRESNHKLEQRTMEPIDLRNINPSDPLKLTSTNLTGEGNPSKRKESEKNGYIIDDGNRPSKSAKLSFHQPIIENGRKLEPSRTVIQFGQNGVSLKNHGVQIKQSKTNGFITPQRPLEIPARSSLTGVTRNEKIESSVKGKPPHHIAKDSIDVTRNENGVASAKVKAPHPDSMYPTDVTRNENGEVSTNVKPSHLDVERRSEATRNANGEASARVKPPHPDAKYLSRIFDVPAMEDLHDESLDEEWLFGGNHLPLKKLNAASSSVDSTQQVWSEAVQIESADISALPYVLPY